MTNNPNRRLVLTLAGIWVVLVAAGSVVIGVLNFPPQPASNVSRSIQDTIRLITWTAWPIFTLTIVAVIGTVLLSRRHPNAAPASHDRIRGNARLAGTWIGIVTAIVLVLGIVGTLTLSNEGTAEVLGLGGRATGSGTTGGPPEEGPLEVQVIAQQWQFTYRYPSFGGFESAHLVVPVNRTIDFHITSLDVTHSFWLAALGVKADAVPEHDNTFDAQPTQIGTYRVVCGELCGLWHGGMNDNNAQVVSTGDFATWVQQQQAADAPIMKYLPPYSHTYVPDPPAYGT
ncbi:MAG: cytochrome c oxidase subunit II [Candidatus Dormibacteraeota bacterium]|nr:cytochrome c oxidase subunit II [Candidatus Dormibacteraeota bacterium]